MCTTPIFLQCIDSSQIMFVLVQNCAAQRKFPFPPIVSRIDEQRTVLCSVAQLMEKRLYSVLPYLGKFQSSLIHFNLKHSMNQTVINILRALILQLLLI